MVLLWSLPSVARLLIIFIISLVVVVVDSERAYPWGCSREHPSYYNYEPSLLHSFSSPFPPVGLEVKTVNDYLIVRQLGTGKFSDVFEAVDVELERNFLALASTTTTTTTFPSQSSAAATTTTTTRAPPPLVVDPRTLVVLKCLKPVSERKIRREILVLQHASKLPNLARLLAIVVPDAYYKGNRSSVTQQLAGMPSLVLEHAGPDSQWLSHHGGKGGAGFVMGGGGGGGCEEEEEEEDLPLSDYDIRYYLYHLLVGLDALHSIGIMHRDVKPRNVLINRRSRTGRSRNNVPISSPATSLVHDVVGNAPRRSSILRLPLPRPLMLIDLGLADFYRPGVKYNVRVASRHYKSPELLLGYEYYDYAIDMWGVGCILAGLLWNREPFFRGKDNLDQLSRIITVLGTSDLIDYIDKYKMELPPQVRDLIARHQSFEQQQQQQPQAESTSMGSTSIVPSHKDSFWVNFQRSTLTVDKDKYPDPPSSQGLDLLNKLLVYDHDERLTAQQAMQHPYFDIVRARVQAEVRSNQRTVNAANLQETLAQSPVDDCHVFDSKQ
jgi:casein kinase II subunit alpha